MKNKQKGKGLVPRLRFPGFQGEWEMIMLKNIAIVTSGQSPKGQNYNDIGDGIPFYQGKTDFGEVYIKPPTKWTTQITKLANKDDILMSVRAPVGALNICTQRICIGRGLCTLHTGEHKRFLYYLLTQYNQLFIGNGGSVFDSINKKQIEETILPFPAISTEQQRIADCLSSLDDLISAEGRKLEALRAHKKGLMQQLFPREGEAVPRLRFPGFSNVGDWKNKQLKQLCKVLQGYGFPEALQGRTEGKYPFCKVSDISKAVAENGGILASAANYLEDLELSKLKAKLIPAGAVVFAKIGEALRLNRRAFVQNECLIDNNVVGLKAIHGIADDYFVYLLSQMIDLNEHCGGAVPSVNKSTLEAIWVAVPELPEQQRIADCLSSLDDLIVAQARKVELLKQHKKGLMQQLFPVMEEAGV